MANMNTKILLLLKKKTISKKCLAYTSFKFLEHFENVTISILWLQKLIYHPKDLENVLYEIYALVQKKSCVKLFTDIKNSDPSHELGPVRRQVMKPVECLQGLFRSICYNNK